MVETYKVLFEGKIKPGHDKNEVVARLLLLYKGDEEKVKYLFSSKKIVIKKNLDYKSALKYQAAFENAGALCTLVKEKKSESDSPPVLKKQATMAQESQSPDSPAAEVKSQPRPISTEAREKTKPEKNLSFINIVALVVIIFIISTVIMRLWVSKKLDNFVGIDHVAVNSNTVLIHAGGTLYFQKHDGTSQQRIPLSDLGLDAHIADIALMADGSVLIGDQESRTIKRCNVQNSSCEHFAPAGNYSIEENFKFLLDEANGLLFIADTNNNRLLIQNLADVNCFVAETTSKLNYPNDMVIGDNNILYLCDTNRFRILSFEVGRDSVVENGEPIMAVPDFMGMTKSLLNIARTGDKQQMKAELEKIRAQSGDLREEVSHAKPFSLAIGPDNSLWVVLVNTMMSMGGIKVFDQQGEVTEKISLGADAVPVDIVKLENEFLVVDSGTMQAYTIHPVGLVPMQFGDAAFQEAMADLTRNRSILSGVKAWSLKATLFFGVVALGVLFVSRRQNS